ncbi:RlpA-like double-psi beta-barrel-protein domain-containing protein-containing protein [Syncephalis plumigaleata]|nr:RlpA-like double-psi beta-barrel-protein domain-containing protein-containing protein [Syncephalis plumigaleata]
MPRHSRDSHQAHLMERESNLSTATSFASLHGASSANHADNVGLLQNAASDMQEARSTLPPLPPPRHRPLPALPSTGGSHRVAPSYASIDDAADWRRSSDRSAVPNYYADKPLPLPPSAYVGPPATGVMGPFINFYRRNRRAVLFAATLLAIGIIIIIVLTALGHFGVGHGTQNDNDYNKGKQDTGYGGLPISGRGDGTYYDPEGGVKGGIGSCGWVYKNDDMVAALNAPQYGAYARPGDSPVCGACLVVSGPNGKVRVKVVDKCPVCKSGDVDLSEAAFVKIADKAAGRVKISWRGC